MSIQSALVNAAGALSAFSRVLDVTQNNVTNASTPGYVKQTQTLQAGQFDLASGLSGGVRAGEVESARDQFAEQAVRRETTALGTASQNVESLTQVESAFDISKGAGLAGALDTLFSSFSALGASPTDTTVSQTVIDAASKAAQAFQQAAAALTGIRGDTESQLASTVEAVNKLTAQLAEYNKQAARESGTDAGLDANINSTVEQLSQYAGITVMPQAGGAVNVLLDGQIPLVLGTQQYALNYTLQAGGGSSPDAQILSGGADVTSYVDGGSLGALLDVHNRVLPSYLGDANSAGSLNTMAQQFADRVNQVLSGGTPGLALFTYNAPEDAARTIAVDPTVTAGVLASLPGATPTALAGLSGEAQDALGGATFTAYYGQMAGSVGSDLSAAQTEQQTRQGTVAQAKSLREQMSGVSLDEEAMNLIEFQRAYEASSKLITTLDQLTLDAINMLTPT
jgi:flagellar hook-associated protein 1 FlgK